MSNKTVIVLIAITIALMAVLFISNYVQVLETESTEEHIELNAIRGMEIYHDNIPYTLNLKQQVGVATYLNEATHFEPTAAMDETKIPTAVEKIIIFRFENLPPIEVTPIYYDRQNLVFSAPEWREKGLFMDNSNGKLKDLLAQTFDR
jgi:hypothetical protein